MKTRLKVLCWLFVATYATVIVHSVAINIVAEFSAFRNGFDEGFNASKESVDETGKARKSFVSSFFGSVYVKLKPIYEHYPDKFVNEKTGEKMGAEIEQVRLSITDLPQVPRYLIIGNILTIPLAFVMLFIIIYIPVLSFKTIKSIVKNDIFDEGNIRRIRRIGYSLIIVSLFGVYCAVISKATALHFVSLKDYKIVSPLSSEDIFIVTLGIVVLIFAEVLKIATQIKEEQDLTV